MPIRTRFRFGCLVLFIENITSYKKSMYKFIELKGCDYGIRTSLELFSCYENVKVVPLYALSKVVG